MTRRTLLAFFIAPLVPAFAAAVLSGAGTGTLMAIPIGMMFYAPVAWLFAVGLGVPAYLVMRRRSSLSAARVLGVGFGLGALSGLVMPLLLGTEPARLFAADALPGSALLALGFALCGTVTAGAFWLIGLRGVPRGEADAVASAGGPAHR